MKDQINSHKVQILVLLEPKVAHVELARFAFSLGFSAWAHGADTNSHVWIVWKDQCSVQPLYTSSQEVTVEMRLEDKHKVIVSCVYASCLKRIHQGLWSHLEDIYGHIQNNNSPWISQAISILFRIVARSGEDSNSIWGPYRSFRILYNGTRLLTWDSLGRFSLGVTIGEVRRGFGRDWIKY